MLTIGDLQSCYSALFSSLMPRKMKVKLLRSIDFLIYDYHYSNKRDFCACARVCFSRDSKVILGLNWHDAA